MSLVTNVILSTPLYFDEEKDRVTKEINAFFDNDDRGFVNCDDDSLPRGWYGGTKFLEAELFIGAFNYLNINDLIEHLKTRVDWGADDLDKNVQLIVKEQEDDKFRIIDIEVR